MYHRPAILRVPNEVLDLIFTALAHDTATILSLCMVSRSLLPIAQAVLFRRVDFAAVMQPLRCFPIWAGAVATRSHLAHRVRVLCLRLPPTLGATDASKLARALTACVNVKELSLLTDYTNWRVDPSAFAARTQSWKRFGGRKFQFQLVKFTNEYFEWDENLRAFLSRQDSIQSLRLCESTTIGAVFGKGIEWTKNNDDVNAPEARPLLPNLLTVSMDIKCLPPLRYSPRLERIETTISGSFACRLGLGAYSSLTTLNVIWPSDTKGIGDLSEIIRAVAALIPRLLHFTVRETCININVHNLPCCVEPVETLSPFQQLASFALVTKYLLFKRRNGRCFDTEEEKALAGECLRACLTLRHVTIECSRKCTYSATRDEGGEVHELVEREDKLESLSEDKFESLSEDEFESLSWLSE
ncbi:hypothetical protein MKEN_00740800 [Mycena kentingensis (nom. inval.)]|nr:hypothetical protein MKEN_00740800 [Mycena kentingensis (nom. inval.)]